MTRRMQCSVDVCSSVHTVTQTETVLVPVRWSTVTRPTNQTVHSCDSANTTADCPCRECHLTATLTTNHQFTTDKHSIVWANAVQETQLSLTGRAQHHITMRPVQYDNTNNCSQWRNVRPRPLSLTSSSIKCCIFELQITKRFIVHKISFKGRSRSSAMLTVHRSHQSFSPRQHWTLNSNG